MKAQLLITVALAAAAVHGAAQASAGPTAVKIGTQLSSDERSGYREIFAGLRSGDWIGVATRLETVSAGPLRDFALAELYLAKGSPRVELPELTALLARAPYLPHAQKLYALAQLRGGTDLAPPPQTQTLKWIAGAPIRGRAASLTSDSVAATMSAQLLQFIKDDRPESAEALVTAQADLLSPEALTEWQQRVAWSYYLTGNDVAASTLAARAAAGSGEWAVHANWVQGLAAWRQHDYRAAIAAFDTVAHRSGDMELRAAGLYWGARAAMASGKPDTVQQRLRVAAGQEETFYGLLARQALGITARAADDDGLTSNEWSALKDRPNIQIATSLVEINENALADTALRHQARLGAPQDHAGLLHLAARLNLPATQIWLCNNAPVGVRPSPASRYPAPDWKPERGWRVDKSLVFAHTLQESRFRSEVISPAGAYGLMQVRPGTAGDTARRRGDSVDGKALFTPATNFEYGQSYLEELRDKAGTGGLLPKVIAAYNAGPLPVEAWNARGRDRGDPLLYIESIPYWETRGYVAIVLRNYWMYQQHAGVKSPSRAALAQGLWPRFPGMPGATAVRLQSLPSMASADTAVSATSAN